MIDITAIMNVHCEGVLAHASLESMRKARDTAEASGLRVEILVVADCPDQPTMNYLADAIDVRVVQTAVNDLGLARNVGVSEAQGNFVAFLDGDDLWGPAWLLSAHNAACCDRRGVVWHPEANLYFGSEQNVGWLMHPDMEDAEGDWVTLGMRNHWTALSFGETSIYRKVPYRRTDLAAGFGYEDWSWNSEVVAQGYLHRPVPGTIHMIRVRDMSLLRRTIGASALPTQSSLFPSRVGWSWKVGSAGIAAVRVPCLPPG